jgi:hypothetical protein
VSITQFKNYWSTVLYSNLSLSAILIAVSPVIGMLIINIPLDLSFATTVAIALTTLLFLIACIRRKFVFWSLTIGFIIRAGFALSNWHYNFIDQRIATDIFNDSGYYILSRLQSGIIPALAEIKGGLPIYSYSVYVAAIYSILGHDLVQVLIVNSFLDICAIYILYRIALQLFGKRAAYFTLLIEVFSPYTAWMNGTFLRESLIRLLLICMLWALVKIKRGDTNKVFITMSIAFCLSFVVLLRPENLPIFVVLAVAVWYIQAESPRLSERTIILLLIGIPVVIGLMLFIRSNAAFLFRFEWNSSEQFFEDFRSARDHGESVYLTEISYNAWWQIVAMLPVRLFYFLYVPLPWHITGVSSAFAFLDTLLYFSLTIIAIRYFFSTGLLNKDKLVITMLLYFIIGAGAFAIVESNIGAALRHRREFVFIVTLLASASYSLPARQSFFQSQRHTCKTRTLNQQLVKKPVQTNL